MQTQLQKHKEHTKTAAIVQKKNTESKSFSLEDNRASSKATQLMEKSRGYPNDTGAVQMKVISETSDNQEVAQLGKKKHPKKASGSGMARKDPGHGNVKSKQHAKKRAKKDGKRAAKRQEEIARLQKKREDEERGGGRGPGGAGGAGGGIAV